VIVPHGDTVLQAGDVIEIFGLEEELSKAELCLS
jgi:Trk K+ transport system NAD-binding subunit